MTRREWYFHNLRVRNRKENVLAELLRSSWMRDAGWTDEQIAAHHAADRRHRAAVIWERRRKYFREKNK